MRENDLETLRDQALVAVAAAATLTDLEEVRIAFLGRKSDLTSFLRQLGTLTPEDRRVQGEVLNAVRATIDAVLTRRRGELDAAALETRLVTEAVDVTLQARPFGALGRIHPLSQTWDELVAIFGGMDFSVAEGPDIEDDFHNFTALNIPPEHPARQEHDTFYFRDARGNLDGQRVLRTHTSPVQIRTMRDRPPPLRIIAPGRAYRSDSDATHTPMFAQVEGLVIGRDVHFGHLKGCLEAFCRAYFEIENAPLRFRSSYFPFTVPSAEVDIRCARGADCLSIGVGDDWMEILGCGMVHPAVLRACGLDPEQWQGFAFGVGIERITMLKQGIPDLRMFFDADLRWLRHYGVVPLECASLSRGLSL